MKNVKFVTDYRVFVYFLAARIVWQWGPAGERLPQNCTT